MSKIADQVYDILKQLFPHNFIIKEYYINYKGIRLFFDFYIKDLQTLIEVQGTQHDGYVSHFHVDRDGFIASKKRDNLKIEYCELNKIPLVFINHDEKIDKEILLKKMIDAFSLIVKSNDDGVNNKR